MSPRTISLAAGVCALIVLALTLLAGLPAGATGHSIESPDTAGDVGFHASLALDNAGNPVVSYLDATNGDLKVLHCNDPNCAGGNESVTAPDTAGLVGDFTSLALDDAGYPVVSYHAATTGGLKVLHCNDSNCAGGDESITTPDTAGNVGEYTSLALDDSGYPVVSHFDSTNFDLKLVHCNDPLCAGGNESVTAPDTAGFVGEDTSLALDSIGNPVVIYRDLNNPHLKLLHCNDANCVGGDESVTAPDTAGFVGSSTSLTLDGTGNPVVSYQDSGKGDLEVLHCNDANCAGGDESVTAPDTAGNVGSSTSLALDGAGNPVVSYQDFGNGDLKVLHCNDAACAGGDESITAPDAAGFVGTYTSLALDTAGNPVVGYTDSTNGDLKLLHCSDPNCTIKAPPTDTPPIDTATATNTPPTTTLAQSLAAAMDIPGAKLKSASLNGSDEGGVAVWSSSIGSPKFPTEGGSFAILSTGLADDVDLPNDSESHSTELGGQDTSQFNDLAQLDLTLNAPNDANCLQFDFAFFSEEYPEFVGSIFNDTFIAEVGGSTFTIAEDPKQVMAPNNIAYDPVDGSVIDLTSPLGYHTNTGTTYDGATNRLSAGGLVTPGAEVQLTFSIMDLGDSGYDSTVFLDNFRWAMVDPDECQTGIQIGTPTPTNTPTNTPQKPLGDVDDDGDIDAIDATLILSFRAGLISSLPNEASADVDQNGSINATDASLILQIVAGIIPGPGTPTPTNTPPGPPPTATLTPEKPLGDVNDDGDVDAVDATLILRFRAGLISSLPNEASADVNLDGSINAADASLILQLVAGIIPGLPPP
ncbi:MAG: choice-of-anchor L domain-containing protein [Dehalococcoidia bacterium]|nr:choice-of-anchor L domain-containing protein [Dehalococcoidia bacterium]